MTFPLWLQIVALAIPALISIFSAIWATRSARKAQAAEHEAAKLRALEERVDERKYQLYQPFVQAITDIATPSRKEATKKHVGEIVADFQAFVTLWASDEVNEMFYRYRMARLTNPPSIIIMRLLSDFLLAVRRDVAWPDTKIDGMHVMAFRFDDEGKEADIAKALTMPLDELFSWQEWKPNFELRTVR